MRSILAFTFSLMLTITASAAGQPVDYERDVKPLLRSRCYACHGGLKQESELRLDTGSSILKGGDSGAAVVAGKSAQSLLLERIVSKDDDERMPPEGKPLKATEIQLIKRWIDQGAQSPKDEQPEEDPRKHWAFQKPIRPVIPTVKNLKWVNNPIDAFLAKHHETQKLQPAGQAEKHVLLRRLSLDVIGLPPTREELQSFQADNSTDAYEQLVDKLLDRPEYGERWGRHWMDVWRYSDWYGRRKVPDVLNSYGQVWRWRDWIVNSLNEDKGYDRMVMQMLAADEMNPSDDKNVVATGFVIRNFYRWNYNIWMKDNVEHTAKAFLGLTLNCCHCHSHKYDPIENEEYFRFRAFFEPIEIRHDRTPGEADPGIYPKYKYGSSYKPITTGMVRVMDEKLNAKTFIYSGGEARNIIKGLPPVLPGVPKVLGVKLQDVKPVKLPPEVWYPGLKPFVQQEEIAKRETELAKVKPIFEKAKQLLATAQKNLKSVQEKTGKDKNAIAVAEKAIKAAQLTFQVDQTNLKRAQAELDAIKARVHADNVRYKDVSGKPKQLAQTASKSERLAALETTRLALARAERTVATQQAILKPNAKQQQTLKKAQQAVVTTKAAVAKAEKALKSTSDKYTPLSPQYPKQSSGRRTALAKWMADKNNPLTARIAVNHIWLRHFGRAIVGTTENFGRNGDRPTHPQLLDWLAIELMENNWSMKHIHRLILTSNAYRMRSHITNADQQNLKLDRDNVYLWKFNPSRMEAETIRDSILHVAGSLDHTMGGKEISLKLGMTIPRRSLYFEHHGEQRMLFLEIFDAADPCDCYRRSDSVRPQQALAMSNSELLLRESRLLAKRLIQQTGKQAGNDQHVVTTFEQILNRSASKQEHQAALKFLSDQQKLFQIAKPANLSAGTKNVKVPASTDPATRALENLIQALFSHHDFVTIR